MIAKQNDIEYLADMVNLGKMTADHANVEKVRMQRVLLVLGKLPASVRKALNTAVKIGYLAHKKKDHMKPEVYYHPSFEHFANAERRNYEKDCIENLRRVYGVQN